MSNNLSSIEYPTLPTVVFDKKFVEEQIVSLYFQANSKTSESLQCLADLLKNLLDYLILNMPLTRDYLILLYRMIGQTRDCFSFGKGEQQISYMMIFVWFSFFPDMACYAIRSFVVGKYPYGSWRDIKYLCQYVRSQTGNENHPIIGFCVSLMNQQLHNDFTAFLSTNTDDAYEKRNYSLVAKWIPRENKKFHWVFNLLVLDWFSTYQTTILSKCEYESIKYFAAISKCKRLYRQMVATLNKKIDTIEVSLCENKYSNIKPGSIPQIAFMKYKKLLLNDSAINTHKYMNYIPKGSSSSNNNMNSIDIGLSYINKKVSEQNIAMHFYLKHFPNDLGCFHSENDDGGSPERKMLSNIPISYYVKEALTLIGGIGIFYKDESVFHNRNIINNRELLNKQWAQMSNNIGLSKLYDTIPFLDMSEPMYGEPLYTAIGIACLIAERTSFGKKILVYDNQPTWVNLDACDNFVSMIECLYYSTEKTTKTRCNIISAVELLLDALRSSNTSDANIRLLKCVFISNQYNIFQQMIIKNLFLKRCNHYSGINTFTGINTFMNEKDMGHPKNCIQLNKNQQIDLKPSPIFVFWNVSSEFFPDIKVDSGCFFFSGESIYPLHLLDKNRLATSFEMVKRVLFEKRYELLDLFASGSLESGI